MKGDSEPSQSIWEVEYALERRKLTMSKLGAKRVSSRQQQVFRSQERRAYRLVQFFVTIRSSLVSFGGKHAMGTLIHGATSYPEENLSTGDVRREAHWTIRRVARDMSLDVAVKVVNTLLQPGSHYISNENRTAVQYLANARVLAYAPSGMCKVAPIAQRGVREYLKNPLSIQDIPLRGLSKRGALAEAEAILASAR